MVFHFPSLSLAAAISSDCRLGMVPVLIHSFSWVWSIRVVCVGWVVRGGRWPSTRKGEVGVRREGERQKYMRDREKGRGIEERERERERQRQRETERETHRERDRRERDGGGAPTD